MKLVAEESTQNLTLRSGGYLILMHDQDSFGGFIEEVCDMFCKFNILIKAILYAPLVTAASAFFCKCVGTKLTFSYASYLPWSILVIYLDQY